MLEPTETAPRLAPVFPLPNVVFFPDTELPLHIFEQRYRVMLRDVTAGEGLIVMALPKPGWEDSYQGSPDLHSIGTIGRVEDLESLPDGRSNLRLVGLRRIEYEEIPSDRPYRMVRWTGRPERPVLESDPAARAAKLDLLASLGYIQRTLAGEMQNGFVLDDSIPFVRAVNQCCALLPVDAALRQKLLEEDDLLERQRKVSRWMQRIVERVARLETEGTVN